MLFSILIAHYNNAPYFKQCYESLKQQTYENFEMIVVDDCSSDDSLEKIKELTRHDSRIKIFENEKNMGVGYTKRRCVELANGEVCGFVDPDDALTSTAIEDSMNAYQNKTIIATYSEIYICNEALNIKEKFKKTEKIKNRQLHFFNLNFEVAHFFTFKKSSYIETEGINAELSSAVDQDLYLKLYEKGDFEYIQKPLYLYRIHEKGVSQEQSKKEKLNDNWDQVLRDTMERRRISEVYGTKISEVENLPKFLFKKQNTFLKKIMRKLKW